jgi:hypothetical protein
VNGHISVGRFKDAVNKFADAIDRQWGAAELSAEKLLKCVIKSIDYVP